MKKIILVFFLLIKPSLIFAENYNLEELVSLKSPWGSTFINNEELIITEKVEILKL